MDTLCWSCYWARPLLHGREAAERRIHPVPIYCRSPVRIEIITGCDNEDDEILIHCTGHRSIEDGPPTEREGGLPC